MKSNQNSGKAIIFVDIRGFSKVSEGGVIGQDFILGYYESIRKNCESDFIKYLGDGAMIVSEHTIEISKIIEKCENIRNSFLELLNDIHTEGGIDLPFSLGFGITRATRNVIEIRNTLSNKHVALCDYFSPMINLASRLCEFARPSGIVIHQESFPSLHYS